MVDAQELARSIVGAVAELNRTAPQPMTVAEQRSALDETSERLLKDERIDKDVMPVVMDLVKAMQRDVEAKAERARADQDRKATQAGVHSELGRLVERYATTSGNPELIRELKPSIMQKAIDEYNANAVLVRRFEQTGAVDWTEMDKLVVKHVSKWSATKDSAEPEKKAGGPAMKNDAPSGGVQLSGQIDIDALSEKQREIANSQISFAVKSMGMSRADAEKRALDLINKAESKIKSAKR